MILTVHNCTFSLGPEKRGMAKLDSAINQLDAYFYREQNRGTFNELDALILALKRKIVQLGSHGRDAETLPLSRLIIERLDDYGKLTLADNLMVQAGTSTDNWERVFTEPERVNACWYRTDVHVELCTHPGYTADTCPYHKH